MKKILLVSTLVAVAALSVACPKDPPPAPPPPVKPVEPPKPPEPPKPVIPDYVPTGDSDLVKEAKKAAASEVTADNAATKADELEKAIDTEIADLEKAAPAGK